MSLWSRIANVVRGEKLRREIDEEIASHIDAAIADGREAAEARQAFGSALLRREESHDLRLLPWLDSLRADAIFGWRQLKKHKATSAAAVFSLALATGACTAAFRIVDALLLRPLPVANAGRLYAVAFEGFGADGKRMTYDSCSYPMFRHMRAAVRDQAEAVAVSYAERIDLTFRSDREMERAYRQYVSGWMFSTFGLRPAAGRLLNENDDGEPGAHPVAVLSYDYWNRRFARDPHAVGRTFRMDDGVYEIVGVAAGPFTGTETGAVTDLFIPMAMKNPRILASFENFWLRTLLLFKPGVDPQPVRERLRATFHAIQLERAMGLPQSATNVLARSLKDKLLLEHAPSGRSNLQRDYRRPLTALGVLVILVLLIATANVANLMTARAAARAREMALRVSIGAGRARLAQLVLLESAWLAFLATAIGACFAWWAAPLIVRMINPPDGPARLALPADWRVLGFSLAMAIGVTVLFGLSPALRASAIKPASALKGGEDPHARRRLMQALIAVQIAFCFVVHFVAGLFVASFDKLANQTTGFSAARVVNLEAVSSQSQPPAIWYQAVAHLSRVPGVEAAALVGWPLMSGESGVGDIAVGGGPPSDVFSDFLAVSPGWFDTMRIALIDGRDFRPGDAYPAVAIVNRAFARQFFHGEDPVGKSFDRVEGEHRVPFQIVGLSPDARLRDNPRLPIRPTVYVPFSLIGRGAFVVRTSSANPLAMAAILRQETPRGRPEFRVTNIRTQVEIQQSATIRERLLAMLGLFFAVVALLLAAIGLYGVLDYSVLQRRREIGIRMAIGAPARAIVRLVTVETGAMVIGGTLGGLALGMLSTRYIEALLFGVKPADAGMLAIPAITMAVAAAAAALPSVIRAVRIDPAETLRAD